MKLVLLLVALTAVYTANCRDQDSNIEALLFPDEPANTYITGEDQLFPNEQVDDASIGETQRVLIGQENQNIDEEVQQMKENYEMGSVSDHRSSMTKERKRCIPTISCTSAGGHCVKKSGDCKGTVDRYGCRGSKKCKCCIPDDITCIPVQTTAALTTTRDTTTTTTPTTTTAATTTTTTDTTTTTTPTTTTAATTTTITDTTTTTAPTTTTAEPTTTPPGCNGTRLSVGSDRFISCHDLPTMNWTDARDVCRRRGLDLYEPKDPIVVSQYLEDNFSSGNHLYFWIGGRGNGTYPIWLTSSVVPTNAPWKHYSGSGATDKCMWFAAYGGNADKGTVFGNNDCHNVNYNHPLCG